MLRNKMTIVTAALFSVMFVQSVFAVTGPYIFDWSIRDAVNPAWPDITPVPLPGHDYPFDEFGEPHYYYKNLYDTMKAQDRPRCVMLVNDTNPVDGTDTCVDPPFVGYAAALSSTMAYTSSTGSSMTFVFADFEMPCDLPKENLCTTTMVTYAKSIDPNVWVVNYRNYAGTPDNSIIWPAEVNRSVESAFYLSSGQNVSNPNCYPYEVYEVHTRAATWGANICPNKRSSLFWAPLEKFSVAKRNLPSGHLLIPWTARFIDYTPGGYDAPIPTREDVVALLQHFRLRGADGYYRLQSTGLVPWVGNYNPDEEENRGDSLNAWKSLDKVFNNPGTLTFLNNTFPTNKTTGVEWSGVAKGSKVAILISNLGNSATSISLPSGYGLPATSDVIPAGTHQLKIYETILPSEDACAKTNGTLTNALYTSYNAGSTDVANYLKFNLSSIAPSAGFATSLYSAKLTTNAPARVGASYNDALFTAADDSWTESTLTWANKPLAISQLASWATPASAATITVNNTGFKSFIQQQANGDANATLVVKDLNASKTSSQYQQYPDSDVDTTNCFKLSVEYTLVVTSTAPVTQVFDINDITWVSEQAAGWSTTWGYDNAILHTGYYYGDVASYIKYDLRSLQAPAGYKAVVDNISVQLLSAGLVGAFYTDAFYTTTDDWTARLLTVWAGRPAKGAQLTSWENGSYMVLTASSSSAWKTYAAAEINGDGFMSLCMEDVGIDPSESQRQSYYGAQPDNHPILTISYHHELLNAPSNCEEAKAQGYQSIADLDGDCYVNISDLAIFVQRWLK